MPDRPDKPTYPWGQGSLIDRPIGVVVAVLVSLLAAVIALDEFHARQGDAASTHSAKEDSNECH